MGGGTYMTTKTIEYYIDNNIHPSHRKTVQVYFDGLCQPCNPRGIACYAFLIKKEQNIIYSQCGLVAEPFSANATNNVAEYSAITRALEWLLANNYEKENIAIKGDSQLVINQVLGKFKVKAHRIIPLYHKVMSLISNFGNIQFEWIPREQNKEADKLSNFAYTKAIAEERTAKQVRTEQ